MYINKIDGYTNKVHNLNSKNMVFGKKKVTQPSQDKALAQDNKSKTGLWVILGVIATAVAATIAIIKHRAKDLSNIAGSENPAGISGIVTPKELYHMTSLENYESIIRDKVIKKSDAMLGDGVFLSDINDLKTKYPDEVLSRMLDWYKGESNKVVLIKIPVADDKFESLIKWRQVNYGNNSSRIISTEWNPLQAFCSKEKESLHGEALEFLFPDEISTDKIESARIIDLSKVSSIKDFWNEFDRLN